MSTAPPRRAVPAAAAPGAGPDGVIARLHRAATAAPDRVATRSTSGQLRYGELADGVGRLAERLVAAGVQPGDVVAVAAARHHRTLEALLAVRAAGAAYVPLEPTLPAVRIDAIVREAAPRLCLVPDPDDAPDVVGVPVAGLDDPLPVPAERAAAGPIAADVLYVIFTSGSTGRPKGVQIAESSVLALLDHMAVEPGLAAGQVLLGVTTPSFDLSVPDLYLPMSVAATLELAPRAATTDGLELRRIVEDCAPDLMQATPSTWRLLLAAGWDGAPAMRVVCGGEGYEAALAADLAARVGEVWNCYGPTETTVWSVMGRLGTAERDPIPMGRPISGTSCRVVTADGSDAPAGGIGELVIGGAGVSRGYLHRPDLDAASFVPDAGGTGVPGGAAPAFRTGDFVRAAADGTLTFVERRDEQVKVRGYRIELGDVETALRTIVGVRQAAVIALDARLVAFVTGESTAAGQGAVTGADVGRAAAALLPAHMVPASVVVAETLPLTPNGKLDRAALRERAVAGDRPDPATEFVSDDPVETLLAELWDEVLPAAVRTPADDFFTLGGDSLAATRMVARTRGRFGVTLGVADLFEAPTLAGFATTVAALLLVDDPGAAL